MIDGLRQESGSKKAELGRKQGTYMYVCDMVSEIVVVHVRRRSSTAALYK